MFPLVSNFLLQSRGRALCESESAKLVHFQELLAEHNAHFDLTAIAQEDWESSHFLDSLLCLPYFAGAGEKKLVDVGSGAGFPGVLLALFLPELEVHLLEPGNKRAVFLKQVCAKLQLENCKVVEMRAEEAARKHFREYFDFATARAVAPLPMLMELTVPLLRVQGQLIALKGPEAMEELAAASRTLEALQLVVSEQKTSFLPPEAKERTILIFEKTAVSEERFPRSLTAMRQRPL